MPRVVTDQKNQWGKTVDIQRSDLWVVDFSAALSGLAKVVDLKNAIDGNYLPTVPTSLATYFCSSIALPELKVRAEPYRRDSKAYQMPSFDEPCDTVKMTFLLDSYTGKSIDTIYRSDLYKMLEAWRIAVRAGRGAMGSEFAIGLDENYRVDYAFNVNVAFLRGNQNPTVSAAEISSQAVQESLINSAASNGIENDLEFSMKFQLINLWLSAFRVSELNYDTAKPVTVDALFYAENIQQDPSTANSSSLPVDSAFSIAR